ncbi:MAG TPA: DUF3618 domain-containing protein [Longimicrobiales bacterium]|nr:DUF3618 domain-containing protein [Longimicrobiales bacterium]
MAERQRSADEIRQDIERTRADMDETVNAIGQRLSPGQIVDELWGRVRHSDAPGAIGDVVREHPLPLALVGIGLTWLAYDRATESDGDRLRRKHGEVGPGTYERAEGRVGPYRGDELGYGDGDDGSAVADRVRDAAHGVGDRVRSATDDIREGASSAGSKVSRVASGAKEKLSGAASSVGDRTSDARAWASERLHAAGEAAGQARHRAGELAGRARHGVEQKIDDQPLAMGAVAFGLGLASGLAVPSTRWEDERMGRTADRIKEEARRTSRDAAEGAKRVAAETKDAVVDVVEREGLKDELKERVRYVADEAVDAAKQTVRESVDRERLSGEGIRDRAREAAERVRE